MDAKITNLVMTVYYDGKKKWADRFLFGDSRDDFNRLYEEAKKDIETRGDIHPIQMFGPDGLEWQDDMVFILDRCYYNFYPVMEDWPDGMLDYGNSLLMKPFGKVGEERTYTSPDGKLKIIAVADNTPMVGGRLGKYGS